MIQPFLQDDAFLEDVRRARHPRLWWLGQSGFLLHWNGSYLLLDPYLSDSLTRKYAATEKPHVRMTARVVAPDRLNFIDIVTSSHNHTDHLDAETLLPLRAANPALRMIVPEANRAFAAQRLQADPAWFVGLNDGQSAAIGPFTFHGIASAHERLDPDAHGLYPYLGYVIECGGYRLYHPGDTVLYDGLAAKLHPFQVDLALLPINGSLPERRVAGNLWGREAAALARDIGARLTIPCHFDLFEFNTVTPDQFIGESTRLGVPHCVLRNGEGLDL